eukprot:3364289-Prymnesium_polylepis.1
MLPSPPQHIPASRNKQPRCATGCTAAREANTYERAAASHHAQVLQHGRRAPPRRSESPGPSCVHVSMASWGRGHSHAPDARARRDEAAAAQQRRVNEVASLLVSSGISDAPPRGGARERSGLGLGPCVQRGLAGVGTTQPPRTPAANAARVTGMSTVANDHYVRVAPGLAPPPSRRQVSRCGGAHGAGNAVVPQAAGTPAAAAMATPRDACWHALEACSAGQPPGASALLRLPPELLLLVLERLEAAKLARVGGTCSLLWMAAGRDELWRPLWERRWQLRPP